MIGGVNGINPFINTGDEVTLIVQDEPGEWQIDRTGKFGRPMYAYERALRKRPDPQIQKFRDTLIPCDDLFRKRLETILNPVPADLEARMARVFPPVENRKGYTPVWLRDELQPFDHFFGAYDA